jgi:hypothetical protein
LLRQVSVWQGGVHLENTGITDDGDLEHLLFERFDGAVAE